MMQWQWSERKLELETDRRGGANFIVVKAVNCDYVSLSEGGPGEAGLVMRWYNRCYFVALVDLLWR